MIFILILFKKDDPIVGSGVKSPVYISMTSKKLLRNIEYDGIHHIDGTYKITHFGYPLLVYGVDKRYSKEKAQKFESLNKRGPKKKTGRRKLAEKALIRE